MMVEEFLQKLSALSNEAGLCIRSQEPLFLVDRGGRIVATSMRWFGGQGMYFARVDGALFPFETVRRVYVNPNSGVIHKTSDCLRVATMTEMDLTDAQISKYTKQFDEAGRYVNSKYRKCRCCWP